MATGLKKFWKLIFGRTTILAVLIIAQLLLLFGGFAVLSVKVVMIQYLVAFFVIAILMYLLNSRMDSDFKLMWIIIILTAPVVGVAFFAITKFQYGTAHIKRRINAIEDVQRPYRKQNTDAVERIKNEMPREVGIFNYLDKQANYPVYSNASVKYFPLGEDKFKELLLQLERAQEFIFMEYFIIARGYMWDSVLEILKRKAAEGVEVRLLYDGTNTLSLLPRNYASKLREYGIQCRVFSPMIPFLATH